MECLDRERCESPRGRDRAECTLRPWLIPAFVIDPANPYRTLEVRGDVTIEPDPELETLKKILDAYGTDLASFPGPLEARTAVTLRPTRVVARG